MLQNKNNFERNKKMNSVISHVLYSMLKFKVMVSSCSVATSHCNDDVVLFISVCPVD